MRRNLFARLFPRAIGNSLSEFLFGKSCERCNGGSFPKRWARYDGTGSWRWHPKWNDAGGDPLDYELEYCGRNGLFSRHWFATVLIAFFVVIAIIAGITDARAAESASCPSSQTCMTPSGETVRGVFRPWPKGDPVSTHSRPSCLTIRAAVRRYGAASVEAQARADGASEADIERGKKCLSQ